MCKSCRHCQELSNDYLLAILVAKIDFDTAENGPLKVYQKIDKSSKKVRIHIGFGEGGHQSVHAERQRGFTHANH